MCHLIGVSGGSGSGKTSTCQIISEKIKNVTIISMDSFYLEIKKNENANEINFDHPSRFDWKLIYETLSNIKKEKNIKIPIYDFKTHKRTGSYEFVLTECIIFEGILALYDPNIRKLFDVKIFVDTPADIRLIRRIRRDIEERKRDLTSVLNQCEKTVIPGHDQFVEPTKQYADLILPRGKSNSTAIDIILSFILSRIE
jgi:uridine kinase